MLPAVEILGSISSVFLLFQYIRSFFRFQESRSRWQLGIFLFLFAAVLSFLNLFPDFVIFRVLCLVFGGLLLCRLFCHATFWQSFFMGVSFEVIAALIEVIMLGVLGFFHLDASTLMSVDTARMIYIITTQLVLLPAIILIGTISHNKDTLLPFQWFLPLLPCQLLSIFVCYIALRSAVRDTFDPFLIFVLVTLLYINITIVFYAEATRASESKRRQAELAEQQFSMQKEYYQRLHESQEETRALWHDIKKYILAMQALAEQKSAPQLQQIVSQAEETLANIGNVVDVDNVVVSSILDNYARIAQETGIRLTLHVMVPPSLSISPVDLYIILGNTLDNAVEACSVLAQELRFIDVMLRKENGILFYRIRNSWDGKEKAHLQGRFHGYGLPNVRKCAAQYGGVVQVSEDDTTFTVELFLNCK